MSLWEDLAAVDKEGLLLSNDNNVCYPTGYKVLDYANGYWSETRDPKTGERKLIPNLGIPAGSMVSIIGASGNGKSIPDLAVIPSSTGLKHAYEFKVGDYLFDRHGFPTKILGIYPQGEQEVFEVTLADGRTCRCSEDHLWCVKIGKDSDSKYVVLSLKEIMNMREEEESVEFYIPANGPVDYCLNHKLTINPWVFGIIVANTKDSSNYADQFSMRIDNDTAVLISNIMNWKCIREFDVCKFYMGDYRIDIAYLINNYPEYSEFWHTGHIPYEIITGSIKVREHFLTGLFSTNKVSIFNKKVTLPKHSTINDVINIIRSLGFNGHVESNDSDLTIEICQPTNLLKIENIKDLGRKEQMRCFYVDNPEHLFLTENYVVTHNTTLAWQIGWNIVKDFKDGLLILIDCEKSSIKQRLLNITGCAYDDPRARILKSHTSIDDVLEQFEMICELKKTNGKKYMYEVKNQSFDGKPFWQYVPTVFVIDSLPSFNSKEYNVKDLGNQIDQMKATKDISRFYTNVLDRAWEFNVIFIVINHIRAASITNPYAKPPRGLMMINPETEVLPRGSVAQYYSGTYFRINSIKSNAYTMKDYGFTGYKCDIQLTKSKSNSVGTTFPVSFISEKGFDPIFSEYEFASSLGLIQGRNPYLYLSGLEERKFNRKEFHNLWSKDEYFRTNFQRILEPYYESLLSEARTFKSPEELIEDNPDLNEELAEQDKSDSGLVFPED